MPESLQKGCGKMNHTCLKKNDHVVRVFTGSWKADSLKKIEYTLASRIIQAFGQPDRIFCVIP